MAHLITLTGPSGCGKSTALTYFLRAQRTGFKPMVIPKYTTRSRRDDDGGEVISGCERLPQNCDLVYEQYGVRYGLALEDIFSFLAEGASPLVILNDVRTVEDVREALGPQVRSLFIFRESPSLERYMALGEKRGSANEVDLQRRFRKAEAIYRIYIENIHLFDHVILNAFGRRELRRQVVKVVHGLEADTNWPLRAQRRMK